MTLKEAIVYHQDTINQARRMLIVLKSELAQESYDNFKEEELQVQRFQEHVKSCNSTELKRWLRMQCQNKLEMYSLQRLRLVARQYHISYYYAIPKEELVQEIINARARLERIAQRNAEADS